MQKINFKHDIFHTGPDCENCDTQLLKNEVCTNNVQSKSLCSKSGRTDLQCTYPSDEEEFNAEKNTKGIYIYFLV